MDRGRADPNEHLVVRGHWFVDLAELEDVG
jgi:hypothetical protein